MTKPELYLRHHAIETIIEPVKIIRVNKIFEMIV